MESVTSTIVVFPVVVWRRGVSAGKIDNLDVDGVVLTLDFLGVDEAPLSNSDTILLALVQHGAEQSIAVYTIADQKVWEAKKHLLSLASAQ